MIGNLNSIFKQKILLGGSAPVYDTDAQAYFTANTAITNSADKTAINDFYLGLKSDGIYTKIKAMYLWKWGSASSDKWNLVNPQDTNAAFRCTFATGFTYSTSGITGNGTSAYIQNFLNPSINLNLNSASYGFYSNTNRTGNDNLYFMGANGGSSLFLGGLRRVNNTAQYFVNDATATSGLFNVTNTLGFFQASRISSTQKIAGYNNTFTTFNHNSTSRPNFNIYLFARNDGGVIAGYETVRSPFAYIGDGLTQTDMSNFRTRVQTLMTYFGINV